MLQEWGPACAFPKQCACQNQTWAADSAGSQKQLPASVQSPLLSVVGLAVCCLSPRQKSGFNSKFQVHAPPLAGFLLDCSLVFHQSGSFALWRIVFSAICLQNPSPNISNRHILQSSCRKSPRQFIYRKIPFLSPSSWCNVNTTSE